MSGTQNAPLLSMTYVYYLKGFPVPKKPLQVKSDLEVSLGHPRRRPEIEGPLVTCVAHSHTYVSSREYHFVPHETKAD